MNTESSGFPSIKPPTLAELEIIELLPSKAHQQGHTAARQLIREYASPTVASSRTMPQLTMAEMLIHAMQQSPADNGA